VPVSARRLGRLAALSALSFYCLLLLLAALPVRLLPGTERPALTAGLLLHLAGITPGMEVFAGRTAPRAIPRMTCFRVSGQGDETVVLYDDLALCRERRVEALRDPFRIVQMRALSEALVHLNLGGRRDLAADPLRGLFLFSDYYCHLPAAERVNVRQITVESLYLGTNLDDGSVGEVLMAGRRSCTQPTWVTR
jgi:hypothetical protein